MISVQSLMPMLWWFATLIAATTANFEVLTSHSHTCATYGGEAKCWGRNERGQLGLGDDSSVILAPPENAIDLGTGSSGSAFAAETMGCGEYHCCALSTEQEVKCWGDSEFAGYDTNIYGDNIGDDEGEMGPNLPVMPCFSDVDDLIVTDSIVCAGTDHGAGYNVECVGYDHEYMDLAQDGTNAIITMTDDPLQLLDGWAESWEPNGVGGGVFTVCALNTEVADALKCFGRVCMTGTECTGYERQHNGRFVQSVQCGADHCCALTGSTAEQIDGDRKLECWGSNSHSQIPSLSNDFVVQDFAATERGTCILSTDRMVICFGSILGSDLGQFELSQSFTASGARLAHSENGFDHLCAYDETNGLILQCWGANDDGQLGYGDQISRGADSVGNVDSGWTVPTPAPQTTLSWHGWGGRNLNECEGDCDNDDHCAAGLYCYHDAGVNMNGPPPGCTGTAFAENADYCFKVPASTGELVWFSWYQTGGLNACQGDCDNDDECSGDLECYHNAGKKGVGVPGCTGTPTVTSGGEDYCYDPNYELGVAAAAGFASGHSDDEPAEDMEPEHAASGEEALNLNDLIMMMVGAAIGVVVVAGIAVLVISIKRKRSAKKEETEMAKAVHVPETSPASVDGVETI